MFVKLMVGLHANNILKLENHKYKKKLSRQMMNQLGEFTDY